MPLAAELLVAAVMGTIGLVWCGLAAYVIWDETMKALERYFVERHRKRQGAKPQF